MKALPVVEAIESRTLLSADLAPSFARPLPSVLSPGSTHKVSVRVANVGDSRAQGAAAVSLIASADGVLDETDVRLGDAVRSLKLKPGKAANVKISVPAPTSLVAGEYVVFAAVTTTSSSIQDVNPANDVAPASGAVFVEAPSIDLVSQFTELPWAPLEAFEGGYYSTTEVRVFNTGNVATKAPLSVGVYLSADDVLDDFDIPLGESALKTMTLKPNGKKDIVVTLAPPPDTVEAGRYWLIAWVDPGDFIAETDDGNNAALSPTQVPVVDSPPPGYDDHYHDDGYYWTDTVWVDTYYYYDDGGWYYTDDPVVIDNGYADPNYYDDGNGYYDDGGYAW